MPIKKCKETSVGEYIYLLILTNRNLNQLALLNSLNAVPINNQSPAPPFPAILSNHIAGFAIVAQSLLPK